MDKLLHNIRNTLAFIDDILFVTKGSKEQHIEKLEKVMRTLDEAGIRLKLEKCKFGQEQTEWLGFTLSEKKSNRSVEIFKQKQLEKNRKTLRSFMRAINQMKRFIRNLVQLCAPLRLLLGKENKWNWAENHDRAFEEIKKPYKH